MRVALNLDQNRLQKSAADFDPPRQIDIRLGDSPLNVEILSAIALLTPAVIAQVTYNARIEFMAIPQDANGQPTVAGGTLTNGAVEVAAAPIAPQILALAENWQSVALIQAIGIKSRIIISGQWRWRQGGNPTLPWSYSSFIDMALQNAAFPDVLIPGAGPTVGPAFYISTVTDYIGTATAIERILGVGLPNLSLIEVVIQGSASSWRVSKPAAAVTNVDNTGNATNNNPPSIALLDGTASLTRVSGF